MNILLLTITLTLGAFASSAVAKDIYKTVDENGNITYSDSPPSEDILPADLPDINLEPALTPKVRLSPDNSEVDSSAAISVSISSPSNEDVILASASSIPVSSTTSRALTEDEYAQLLVNGAQYGPAGKNLSWKVGDLIRGSYSLQVQIVKNGKNIASSQTVSLFVQRNIAR